VAIGEEGQGHRRNMEGNGDRQKGINGVWGMR
jgi:hypothetical protein